MKRKEWEEIIDFIETLTHDFEFQYRDSEDLFNDGFNYFRKKIEMKIWELMPTKKQKE